MKMRKEHPFLQVIFLSLLILINCTKKGPNGPETQPSLFVYPTTLNFGTSIDSLQITIKNTGTGTLSWSISTEYDWLTVSDPTGNTVDSTQVMVIVQRELATVGEHQTMIHLTSNGGNADISVQMQKLALCVSPASLDFGSSLDTLNFVIENVDTGVLHWSINYQETWLTIRPLQGQVGNEADIITATVNRSSMGGGDYWALVNISANDDSINYSIHVKVAPVLSVDVDTLDFGDYSTWKTLYITNTGNGTLHWNIAYTTDDGKGWISNVSPTNGITTTETDAITVRISRSGLASGTYWGWIVISSDGGNKDIRVKLKVL